MMPTIDISRITDAATLKARVAETLRVADHHERAAQWEAETRGNEAMNGLVIKARTFVVVGSSLPADRRPRA